MSSRSEAPEAYRYLKLSKPASGVWPSARVQRLQPGTIIRIPIGDPVPSGPCVFNEETKGWACAHWVETSDPAQKREQEPGDV